MYCEQVLKVGEDRVSPKITRRAILRFLTRAEEIRSTQPSKGVAHINNGDQRLILLLFDISKLDVL